jgi:phenylalanyl-tRNA synthetase beta chain
VRIVHDWLRELVAVPDDPDRVAADIALRGFEVASVEHGRPAVIDFEITANRPDCLSHIGIAREATAIWHLPLRLPDVAMPEAGPAPPLQVEVEEPELCPRYCAQMFEVSVKPSPEWLRTRLEAGGVRPINNVVDVTNYVLLELGQPMHAFDYARLSGHRIIIRRARPGEPLRTLDGLDRLLDPDMVVIADGERATALGGVMGGQESEIDGSTTVIVLESATFHPPSIRRTSKRLGLTTEASIRFERGADIAAAPLGIARAAALLAQIGGGRPLGGLIDRYPAPRPPTVIVLRGARIARVLGQDVPASEVPGLLEPLGFQVQPTAASEAAWAVTVPSFRVDVTREVDLIEEVGRHYGFDRLPVTFPALSAAQSPPDPIIARERLVRQVLTAAGFSEAMTFAFIERQAALPFCDPGTTPVAIANPLSEKFAVLRPSLLPGLVDACAHNRRRARKDVRLFETGSRFPSAGETRSAAFAWCGAAADPHWSGPTRNVDLFDVKGAVEQLCGAFGISAEFATADRPWLMSGRAADVSAHGGDDVVRVGALGQLLPAITEARGFPRAEEMYVAELDMDAIARLAAGDALRVQSLPRFPSIVRDIAIVIDEVLPAAAVRGTIRSAAPATLVSIAEFDRYKGKGVPEGRVSLALRLTFRATDRTLTDEDAEVATDEIVKALAATHAAERR